MPRSIFGDDWPPSRYKNERKDHRWKAFFIKMAVMIGLSIVLFYFRPLE